MGQRGGQTITGAIVTAIQTIIAVKEKSVEWKFNSVVATLNSKKEQNKFITDMLLIFL